MSSLGTRVQKGVSKGLCGLLAWRWPEAIQTTHCFLHSAVNRAAGGLVVLLKGDGETGAVKWSLLGTWKLNGRGGYTESQRCDGENLV